MRLGRKWCLPELSHIESHQEYDVYKTVEGVSGACFELPVIDLEQNNKNERYHSIAEIIRNLSEQAWLKVSLEVTSERGLDAIQLSRTNAIQEVGYISKRLRLFFEWDNAASLFRKVKAAAHIPTEYLKQISATPVRKASIEHLFKTVSAEKRAESSLEFGKHIIGILRLRKAGLEPIDWNTIASIQDEIPTPFEITCTIKRVASAKMDMWLRAKLNRDQFSNDVTTAEKVQATSETLKELSLNGTQVFEYEWILKLTRSSEESLREDLFLAQKAVSRLGEAYIETFGALPSYIATQPGSEMHVVQKEIFPTICYFLPLSTYGTSEELTHSRKTTCLLHRQDGSLYGLDLFNDRFLAFNTIVTGKTGSGKSVFGNALSRALLNDDKLHLIKVDVGGSYKRECSLYGGDEIGFHLDKPSGVDPFTCVGASLTNEKLTVLTELLATLALDEGEDTLSKAYRSEFERALREYYSVGRNNPSLDDFISTLSSLPRREILLRFAKGGVFENAIKSDAGKKAVNRYTYYNFENIHGASNKDYAAGVMAAVIAFVNLEMIRLSSQEFRSEGRRLVFFCDETKFFIDRNAPFFLLTTANFRKFGHAVLLTGQNIEDFFLKRDGHIDRGLVLNSPTKVFFESQSRAEFFKDEFGFTDREISVVGKHAHRGKDYRQFVLQDDLGTRICRLYLTRREYWEMTSSRKDVDRLDALKRSANWLNEDQSIEIMLMQDGVQ